MNFKKILLISIIIIFAFSTTGFGCKKRKPKPSNNTPAAANLPVNQPINNQVNLPTTTQPPKPATEEEKVIKLAEDYIEIYGSYRFGDFSNVENLYPQMSKSYQAQIKNWVSQQKAKYASQFKHYGSVITLVQSSKVTLLNQNKAEVKLKARRIEYKGAWINDNPIDEFGNPISKVPKREFFQDVQVKLIKEDGLWKVNEIKFL